jgi:hypothetical protein
MDNAPPGDRDGKEDNLDNEEREGVIERLSKQKMMIIQSIRMVWFRAIKCKLMM